MVILQDVVGDALYLLVMAPIPIVILLGVVPDLEAGLYFALAALELFGTAWMLLMLVFAQRPSASA